MWARQRPRRPRRFDGKLPAEAELVIKPVNEAERHIPLAKNLDDPVFGGGIPEVKGDLSYRIEFTHGRTRDFKVTAFDYPRLERADAKLTYPDYTHLPEKAIKDTRRVSAVEGTSLSYYFFLNKSVTTATLVAKDKSTFPLTPDPGNATIYHAGFTLDESRRYELVLVDDAGRTNRVPPEFVLEALKSQPPELKLASPRGDQRVSPLEEISFEGEASDEFGLGSYVIAYTPAGGETKTVELENCRPREKRQFNFLLAMENLNARPDQLVSYYLWAEDTGPDGKPRRTRATYFAHPAFDEIFREGQPQDPNQTATVLRGKTNSSPGKKQSSAPLGIQTPRDASKPSENTGRYSGRARFPAAGVGAGPFTRRRDEQLKPFVEAAEIRKASGHLGRPRQKFRFAAPPR